MRRDRTGRYADEREEHHLVCDELVSMRVEDVADHVLCVSRTERLRRVDRIQFRIGPETYVVDALDSVQHLDLVQYPVLGTVEDGSKTNGKVVNGDNDLIAAYAQNRLIGEV